MGKTCVLTSGKGKGRGVCPNQVYISRNAMCQSQMQVYSSLTHLWCVGESLVAWTPGIWMPCGRYCGHLSCSTFEYNSSHHNCLEYWHSILFLLKERSSYLRVWVSIGRSWSIECSPKATIPSTREVMQEAEVHVPGLRNERYVDLDLNQRVYLHLDKGLFMPFFEHELESYPIPLNIEEASMQSALLWNLLYEESETPLLLWWRVHESTRFAQEHHHSYLDASWMLWGWESGMWSNSGFDQPRTCKWKFIGSYHALLLVDQIWNSELLMVV